MQLANDYARQFQTLCAEVDNAYALLNKEQSRLDKQVAALYHEIEKVELDVLGGYSAAVSLQEVLRKRRVVKDEFSALDQLRRVTVRCISEADKALSRHADKHERWCADFRITMSISDIIEMPI
ncbi:hypothetical protein [Paenibacillus sp. Marseille-Q9583]